MPDDFVTRMPPSLFLYGDALKPSLQNPCAIHNSERDSPRILLETNGALI